MTTQTLAVERQLFKDQCPAAGDLNVPEHLGDCLLEADTWKDTLWQCLTRSPRRSQRA
jgi:hypothetical protein